MARACTCSWHWAACNCRAMGQNCASCTAPHAPLDVALHPQCNRRAAVKARVAGLRSNLCGGACTAMCPRPVLCTMLCTPRWLCAPTCALVGGAAPRLASATSTKLACTVEEAHSRRGNLYRGLHCVARVGSRHSSAALGFAVKPIFLWPIFLCSARRVLTLTCLRVAWLGAGRGSPGIALDELEVVRVDEHAVVLAQLVAAAALRIKHHAYPVVGIPHGCTALAHGAIAVVLLEGPRL